nr:hypothetical protein [Angustibacter aerolatus]
MGRHAVGRARARRPRRAAARRGAPPRAADRARARAGAAARRAARPQPVGVELVGGEADARAHVLGRRDHLVRPHQPVRPPLRPARAGAAGRGAPGADAERRAGAPRAWCRSPRGPLASPPWPTCRTTSGRTRRRSGRRSTSLVADGEPAAGRGRGVEAPGVPPRGGAAAPRGALAGAAQPVRLDGVGPAPGARAVRVRLPHRDLRAGTQAPVRLLRAALPARRGPRRPRRPQGRPARARWRRRAAGAGGARRAGGTRAHAVRAWPTSLRDLARWLGLADVEVVGPGDLAPALSEALAGSR